MRVIAVTVIVIVTVTANPTLSLVVLAPYSLLVSFSLDHFYFLILVHSSSPSLSVTSASTHSILPSFLNDMTYLHHKTSSSFSLNLFTQSLHSSPQRINTLEPATSNKCVLALDEVWDPQNFGALLRTCHFLGN
jgi:hypothetical protein